MRNRRSADNDGAPMVLQRPLLLVGIILSPATIFALAPSASIGKLVRQPIMATSVHSRCTHPLCAQGVQETHPSEKEDIAAVTQPERAGSIHVRALAAAAGLALLPSTALAATPGAFEDPTGISQAFFFVTFVPQNFWLLLVFAPNWKFTRRVFEPLWPLCLVASAHLFIVLASAGKPPEAGTAPIELFNNLFNPIIVSERGLDVYVELGAFPNFAAEEWTHELVWDLFVGRWIWLEGRRRDIFTCHSVLLTNLIGPPGLLLHVLTVQLYAFFRSEDPQARWADPEALRTELDAQRAAPAGAPAMEEPAAEEPAGFKLPEFKNPFGES